MKNFNKKDDMLETKLTLNKSVLKSYFTFNDKHILFFILRRWKNYI
jgi:hypothetical protein